MTRRPLRLAAVLVVGAVVLVACTDGGTSSGRPAPTPDAPTRLEVRDDLVDPQFTPWRSWRAVDETMLELTVTTGPTDCYGADPEIVENDTVVRIQVRVGRVPEAADRPCPAIAIESVVPVRLDAPLAGRQVEPLD
ncbi:MAG: hypothetical protein ACRCY8_10660 [Dermatophilaceae bacterium]